ncbi:hypothetical protein UY3_04715 [Chelonia mydas]|uniref:Uncharacterized protein n=1 Tax=Chelonia mydas TaxID=8469 RepID=M7BQT9_CHEMY|nr:hypothetical protein UY3_04715 [Chelonia mydas]
MQEVKMWVTGVEDLSRVANDCDCCGASTHTALQRCNCAAIAPPEDATYADRRASPISYLGPKMLKFVPEIARNSLDYRCVLYVGGKNLFKSVFGFTWRLRVQRCFHMSSPTRFCICAIWAMGSINPMPGDTRGTIQTAVHSKIPKADALPVPVKYGGLMLYL